MSFCDIDLKKIPPYADGTIQTESYDALTQIERLTNTESIGFVPLLANF